VLQPRPKRAGDEHEPGITEPDLIGGRP